MRDLDIGDLVTVEFYEFSSKDDQVGLVVGRLLNAHKMNLYWVLCNFEEIASVRTFSRSMLSLKARAIRDSHGL